MLGADVSRTTLIFFAVLFLAVGGYALWERQRANNAEQELGLDAGRVLSAVFTQARDLRVATLKGEVVARSVYNGWLLDPEQNTKAPYSVNYFVNLEKIGAGDLRWDAKQRTMLVRVPDVAVEQAAIDFSKAQVKQKGLWISRDAGIQLQRRGAGYLLKAADNKSYSDEMIGRARVAAAEAMTEYVRQPLVAAGFRDVRVEVIFPWQGYNSRERWDQSRPVQEVLRDAQ